MHNFLHILLKPDNIPIVIMLFAVILCLWVGFKQALKHDKLVEEGREKEISDEMRK